MEKQAAYRFLSGLEHALNSDLPSAEVMRQHVRIIVNEAKTDDQRKHMRQPEDAFLHHYAFPILFRHMQTVEGIDESAARNSLLSEYFRNMPQYSLASAARTQRHPFSKVIAASPAEIMTQWKGKRGAPLRQSCPDFAFRKPFPYQIVFEGKYFETGGIVKAENDLVTNAYQAFFYRALPPVAAKRDGAEWNYDYSCLFAYDASEEGNLQKAWNGLDPAVREGFWEGANVYVMILRGRAQ